jgi:monoamine oxidase
MHSDSPLVAGGDNYFQDQVAEYCGEFIDSNHKTVLTLAQRFNLTAADVLHAQPNGSTETYYVLGGYYSYAQASNDFQPVHNVLQGQVQATGYPTLYNSYTPAGYSLDHMSLHDWIAAYVPGGYGSQLGQVLDAAYNEEYGADTTDQSALNLIYLLGYKAKPGNFQIYGASDERFHIAGGNQQLPEAIATYLTGTGLVSIKKNSRMNTVARNKNGTISLLFDGSSTPVIADQVILCMSFSVLRTLNYSGAGFDPLKQTAVTQLGSGRNAKLQLQFDTRYWNQAGPWGMSNGDVYTDLGFQNAWEVTRAQSGSNGILVNYSGGSVAGALHPNTPYSNAGTNSQVTTYAKAFLRQLETVFPGISAHWTGRATLSTPFLDPNLNCSYAYWRVGQYTQFSGYEKAAQGAIHFAGEHCSQDFQGFMEGGAQEGARAASEVLALVSP